MKCFDPNPELRWMFCMTHPDDEISICAWIKRLTSRGNEVFLTWTHSKRIREQEARAVAFLLGVRDSHLHFFNAADGQVVDEIPELIPAFRRHISDVQPDRIACGAFECGHLDHDATNYIVNHAWDGPTLEIPFYHTYTTRLQTLNRFADPMGQELLRLRRREQAFKTHIARQYPSQNIWSVLLWYEVWQKARLSPDQLRRTERLRWQRHRDYRSPNLPWKMAKKVMEHPNWQRWDTAVRMIDKSP